MTSIEGFNEQLINGHKTVVKNANMPEEMQQEVFEVATKALCKYSIEKDIASFIKKYFDQCHQPLWHCIVGPCYGSYVSHEEGRFIYFRMDRYAILLFKTRC